MNARIASILIVVVLLASCAGGQSTFRVAADAPWSSRIAESFLVRHPGAVTYDSGSPSEKWNYEQGLMLTALRRMWIHTRDERYFDFVRANIDRYVDSTGTIRTYDREDYNLDNITPGRTVLSVYQKTRSEQYRIAAETLHRQITGQPRTHEGGFWHKKIYPYQMWLDGLYMSAPFRARYAELFNDPTEFDDIVNQFVWIASHTRDANTGLLYHAWDESRKERWSNPETGCSPNFWGRAMGWYAMALVDVLEIMPDAHPRRNELVTLLQDLSAALLKVRDPQTGLWFQVVDRKDLEGNYHEASASCMFAYAFAKGANKGYLDSTYILRAKETFEGVVANLVTVTEEGLVDLHGTCRSAGLGGTPYRDGSAGYYIGEPKRTNDMKGIGPFILAAIEIELAQTAGSK